MSYGVGCRHSSDLAWLWLWCRLAATAKIQPLAWEHPYATGVALKRIKKKKSQDGKIILDYPGDPKCCHMYLHEKEAEEYLTHKEKVM